MARKIELRSPSFVSMGIAPNISEFDGCYKNVVNAFISRYQKRFILKEAFSSWTCGIKNLPTLTDFLGADCVIDGSLNVYFSEKSPAITKDTDYQKHYRAYSVSLCGMGGTTSPLWDNYMFEPLAHPNMISEDQFDLMCFIQALACAYFYIPAINVKTLEELSRQPSKRYPNGYFPKRWDLMGVGPEMRARIKKYTPRVMELLNGRDD